MKNIFLTLHVFRGKITYNEKGECTSENNLMKIEANTRQFDQFIAGAANTGFTKIVVKEAKEGGTTPVELSSIAELVNKIEGCVNPPEKKLTPEQQELKELRERLAKLEGGSIAVKEDKKPAQQNEDSELEEVRQLYFDTLKKKPHHKMSIASMREEIENA